MYNFVSSVDKNRFDEFVNGYEHTSFFSYSVRKDIKEADNRFKAYLTGMEDDKGTLVAVALLFYMPAKKIKTMRITYGPVLDYNNQKLVEEFLSEIEKFSKKLKIDVIEIEPPFIIKKYDNKLNLIFENDNNIVPSFEKLGYLYLGLEDLGGNYQLRRTSIVDLSVSEDDLFKKMSSSKRTSINKNDKYYKIKIIEGTKEDLKYLIKYRNQLSEKKDFFVEPLSYYETYYELVNKEHKSKVVKIVFNIDDAIDNLNRDLELLKEKIESAKEKELNSLNSQIASLEKRIAEMETYKVENSCVGDYVIGCALRVYYKDTMVNLFAHVDKNLANIGASNVLVYEMLLEAKKDGYKYNDLYGLPNPFDKDSLDYSVGVFKLDFGGDVIEYVGAFKKVLNVKRYKLFNLIANIRRKIK
jgi:Uncharacterized protein involved in methicillin resistance